MSEFWMMLLAVLAGLWIQYAIRDFHDMFVGFKRDSKQHAEEHRIMMNQCLARGDERGAEMHGKFYGQWAKSARWYGLR